MIVVVSSLLEIRVSLFTFTLISLSFGILCWHFYQLNLKCWRVIITELRTSPVIASTSVCQDNPQHRACTPPTFQIEAAGSWSKAHNFQCEKLN